MSNVPEQVQSAGDGRGVEIHSEAAAAGVMPIGEHVDTEVIDAELQRIKATTTGPATQFKSLTGEHIPAQQFEDPKKLSTEEATRWGEIRKEHNQEISEHKKAA